MSPASPRIQSRETVRSDGTVPTLIPSHASFITRLIDVVNAGGGLVPFVGSGCSAQSGIVMGQQFDEYLAYAVFLCVADEESIEPAATTHSGRWDLRRNGWPNQPTPAQADKARSWVKKRFMRICKDSGFTVFPPTGDRVKNVVADTLEAKPEALARALSCPLLPRILRTLDCKVNQDELRRLHPFFGQHGLLRGGYSIPGLSPTSYDAIEERAIRSLYDWRATLHFLSELKAIGRTTLLVEPPDPAIIDSFNVHITAGRKPNLTQNMLCHLAGPARFRTILTTNFDTLIEDAFQEMKEKLAVISVSIKGSLPDPGIVHARNTVVKLHGTLWETRADFSLDESPSLENKRRFFHYVRGEYPDNLTQPAFLPGQLFVCGYSGSDNRSVEMIKYVLDASEDAQLYWVCHNEADFQKLQTVFREHAYAGRIFSTITERSDLLLYELYQRLQLSLPRGGFSYQYTHNVPPDASDALHESKRSALEGAKIASSAKWFSNPETSGGHTSRPLLLVTGFPGVLAVLREMVARLTKDYGVSHIWLELEDYRDTYSLAYDFFLILSVRLGLFQLSHADLVPARLIDHCEESRTRRGRTSQRRDDEVTSEWIDHLHLLLAEYFNIVPGKWVIILYGRNGPGGCAGWTESNFWGRGDNDNEYGSTDKVGRFPPFIKALCSVGFHVAYAPYGEDRFEQNKKKAKQLKEVLHEHLISNPSMNQDLTDYTPPPSHENKVIDISFAPSNRFNGVIIRRFPEVKIDSRSKVVDFKRCMAGICKHWIMRSAQGKKGQVGQAVLLDNLRLLYAASLFRQSRHYSAFLSEAVMHCPHRFNAVGRDNDWIRSKSLEDKLESLRSIGLFYEKPGGFAWTYWDFRLGLRRMITSLPISYLQKKGKSSIDIEPLRTWRSHYHYWISDWYMRAFYTTGHSTPIMEAVYHLYQTIRYMGDFRADSKFRSQGDGDIELAWRRYRWWRIAVCDMAKALRIGRDAIRLWFGPAKFREWFDLDRDAFVKELTDVCKSILRPLPEAKTLLDHAESVTAVLSEELRQLMLLGSEKGRIKGFVPTAPYEIQRTNVDWGYLSELNESSLESDNPYVWEGVAPAPIRALCNVVCETLQKYPNDSSRINRKLAPWLKEQFQTDSSDQHFFYLAQQLNEWAFIIVRRAKLEQLIKRYERFGKRGPLLCLETTKKHLWTVVTILTNTVIELCRALHPMLDTFEQKERVRALCLYGLALGRLGRFYEAHRRLNEANALLSKIAVPSSSVLLGILKIRRGEVHLLEAMLLADLAHIRDWRALNRKHLNERYGLQCGKAAYTQADKARLFRLGVAKLDDAWCSLESAEHLLAGKLHSSRWWARLCVLKLRCLAEQPEVPPQVRRNGEMEKSYRLIAQRQQTEPFEQIWELFSNGVASSLGHPRLRLRLVDFALRAALRIDLGDPPTRTKRLERLKSLADTCLSRELEQGAGLRQRYAGKINELLTESVEHARAATSAWKASASSL